MNLFSHLMTTDAPADCWEKAYPVGCGRLGGMIYGGTDVELIPLNEDTLWSGVPLSETRETFYQDYRKVRNLVDAGEYAEATDYASEHLGVADSASYQPAGDLRIDFAGKGKAEDYLRTLDLRNALCTTVFRQDGGGVERTVFASYPDSVIVVRLRSEKKSSCCLSFQVQMDGRFSAAHNTLSFSGTMPFKNRNKELIRTAPDGRTGLRYRMACRVIATDGRIEPHGDMLKLADFTDAVLAVAIRSNFRDYRTDPNESPVREDLLAEQDLDNAEKAGWDLLFKRHTADYAPLYARSVLDFPETEADKRTLPERLNAAFNAKPEEISPALCALIYHFGRYLTIAASRPGTQATNLQGIWNPLLRPPWASNYTVNINTEMNYWPTEQVSLPECTEPLLRMVRETSEKAVYAAKSLYHAGGWCLHHNSDIWHFCVPATGHATWLLWPMAGGWFCRHFMEHYYFHPDKTYLREIYPVVRGAAEFFLDILRERNGKLETCPGTSPENGFKAPDRADAGSAVAAGPVMDLSIIRETFSETLEAAEILGIADDPVVKRAAEALPRLAEPKIGPDGQILEYGEDFPELDIHHRHLSHLYGAYPAAEFTPENNPALYRAAIRTLERRGDQSTGWAMGWRAALWARFRDGAHVCEILHHFLQPIDPTAGKHFWRGGIYPNGLDAHPPFQIDGNYGVAAAIAEMFVQSHKRTPEGNVVLDLYPALPPFWKEGSFSGLRARGDITVNLSWSGETLEADIVSASDRTVKLVLPDRTETLTLKAGETVRASGRR